MAVFSFIFISPIIAQDFYILFIFFFGYYGFFFTLQKVGINKVLSFVFSFLYIFNSVTISDIFNGGIVQLLVYFLIPWIYLIFINLLYKKDKKYFILLAFLVVLSTVNIQFSFWINVWLLPFFIICYFNKKIKFENIRRVFLSFFIVVILIMNLFFLIFSVFDNNQSLDQLSISKYTYQESSFLNLFRLGGNNGTIQPKLGYMDNNLINSLFSLFFLFVIAVYLIKFEKNEENFYKNIYLFFSTFILLIIPLLIAIIKNGYIDSLFVSGNVFATSLRNPQKLLYIFSFSYFFILSLSVNNLYKYLKKYYKLIVILLIIIISILYNNFLLDNDFYFSELKGNNTFYITEKDIKLIKTINNINGSGNYLYFPWDYSIQKRMHWEDNIIKIRLGSKMIIGENNEYLLENLYNETCNRLVDINKYNSLNIRYVILDKNPISYLDFEGTYQQINCQLIYRYGTPYIFGEYGFFGEVFSNYSIVFEDSDFKILELPIDIKPEILSNNSHLQISNPIKKRIYISNIKSLQTLIFLESYHKDWKLYLRKNPSNDWCTPIEFYNNTNTTECEHTLKFFEGEELSYLWKKPIFDDAHIIVFDYANSWTIDPQYIKNNYSKEYYIENPDGSIDVELVLYFKPQSYFYLGLIISGTTLVLCIGYLVYDWRRGKRNGKRGFSEK